MCDDIDLMWVYENTDQVEQSVLCVGCIEVHIRFMGAHWFYLSDCK